MFDTGNDQLSNDLLVQLSARGNQRSYCRGEVLIEEGGEADALYILLDGELKVYTRGENGRELVYNVLHPGEFFGELFLDGGVRSASVKAVSDSTCVVVGREQFRDFMLQYPEFAEQLVLKLIARVRHVTEQLRSVATKDVYGRMKALMNELAFEEDGVRVLDKSVTQQEIADRIGATREMVNHVLRELSRGGFIERDAQKRIVLARELPPHW
jgi:CRP/FNR family cyclic AMP-dependent transcriptional regulator